LEQLVHGEHRYKFSHRPNVAVVEAGLATVRLDPHYPASMQLPPKPDATAVLNASGRTGGRRAAAEIDETELHTDGCRSVAVQTAYRDSAAQTAPYTPEYILAPGTTKPPEVLHLAGLTAGGPPGRSLPIGRAEVEAIDLARKRARIEAALPPTTDEASFELRKRLMEQLELANWGAREAEMDRAGEARMAAVEAQLRAREAEREFISEQRIEEQRRRLEREREARMESVAAKRVTLLRKISKQRQRSELHVDMLTGTGAFVGVSSAGSQTGSGKGRKATRDIIAEYADFGSGVYGPRLRDGKFPDKLRAATRLLSESAQGESVEGLADMARTHTGVGSAVLGAAAATGTAGTQWLAGAGAALPVTRGASPAQRALLETAGTAGARATAGAPSALGGTSSSTAAARREAAIARDLERVHTAIMTVKAGRSTSAVENEPVPAWRKPKPVVQRPRTPNFDDEDEGEADAELEEAVLLLQTLLRGRAVQNVMLEGKERRLELIREMRTDLMSFEEAEAVRAAEEARQAAERAAAAAASVQDTAAGEVAAATADFFAKELVRQHEWARITALAAEAEAERSRREAQEAARRAAERGEADRSAEVQRQTSAVHASVAGDLVAALLAAATVDSAEQRAGLETRIRQRFLGPILQELEDEENAAAAQKAVTQPLVAASRPTEGEAAPAASSSVEPQAAAAASASAAAVAATVQDLLDTVVAPSVNRELAAAGQRAEEAAAEAVAAEALEAARAAAATLLESSAPAADAEVMTAVSREEEEGSRDT
jgi:hypothetical protein